MLTVSNATLIQRYYHDITNQPDAVHRNAAVDELLTTDFVFHTPNDFGGKIGVEQHKSWLEWHHTVAPDQTFTVDDIVVDEARGAARWIMRGTHSAAFFGIEASGGAMPLLGPGY